MQIIIKTTNIRLTPQIEDYINKKIGKLEKFRGNLDGSVIARVNIGISSRHHKSGDIFQVEVNLDVPHEKVIRVEAKNEDIYFAIDEAKDILERELNQYKKKWVTKKHRGALILKKLKSLSPLAWFRREFSRGRRNREKDI